MTETDNGIEKPQLSLGFIPLTDCAPLVIAKENGYFAKYGLDVQLSKETSWANIRDKLAIGVLDGAQMLAPMPIAMTLGVGPIQQAMCTALSLDLNGNAITVSNSLYEKLCAIDAQAVQSAPVKADALKQLIEQERRAGRRRLTFAMVFPISTHNYELRYWMAAAGIDLSRVIVIHSESRLHDALWSMEKALQTAPCALVFAWLNWLPNTVVRRLQLAAEAGRGLGA